MKSFKLAFVMAVGGLTLGVLSSACGSDETDDGNQGGSGGQGAAGSSSSTASGSTSTSSSTGSSSSSSGAGGAAPAEGVCGSELVYTSDVLNGCISANCCTTFDPCVADATCAACLESADPEGDGCLDNALYAAFDTCWDASCPLTICGGELSNSTRAGDPLLNYHVCLGEACCDTFTPCEADEVCNACLMDPELPDCEGYQLFEAFTTCRDLNCPFDICLSQIGFVTTYPDFNDASDPNPALNKCLSDGCCAEMTLCADPDDNGYVENDPNSQICLGCLLDPAGCADPAIKTAAEAFLDCVEAAPCD